MPNFEAEFEAELLQQQQKPINAVAETTASVLPSITIDRYSVGDFFVKMSGTEISCQMTYYCKENLSSTKWIEKKHVCILYFTPFQSLIAASGNI